MSGSRNPNLGVIAREAVKESWQRNLGRSSMTLGMPRPSSWWTGLEPTVCPGFASGQLHSLDILDLQNCSRADVLAYFNNTWTINELLFSGLIGEEPFYIPPYHALRHPLIFYYVHPSVLYVSKLRLAGLIDGPINSYFESLFETGVDEMSWDDMSKNEIEWPSIDDAQAYRKLVYARVVQIIESHPGLEPGHAPILQDNPLWALVMGMEHERIHIETSSVLMRELPVHMVAQPQYWPAVPLVEKSPVAPTVGLDYPANRFIEVAAQSVSIGKDASFPTYGWDNEYGHRSVDVPPFAAGQMLVSNGEFWQFVNDGGYLDRHNWSETGWQWRSFRNVKWPTFWVPDGPAGTHQYRLRTIFEIVPMQWSWPAVVNYHEARAFCKWLERRDGGVSYRLLAEAEHQALRAVSSACDHSLDQCLMPPRECNTNLRNGSESPVDQSLSADESGEKDSQKFADRFGNVWQWAEDPFNALEGFAVHRLYDDFSLPCFDGEHQMILGGSFISTGDEATVHARFHFRPHFFQHAGLRVVRSDNDRAIFGREGRASASARVSSTGSLVYEGDAIFDQYMTLHFGDGLLMPWASGPHAATRFPQRCAELVRDWSDRLGIPHLRALDLGCAVGGSTFNLAESFETVIGADLSERFIDAAKVLQEKHRLDFKIQNEGDIFDSGSATVDGAMAAKVQFLQLDATRLPADLNDFDVVLMANLLCRLPDPRAALGQFTGPQSRLKPGGLLVTVSPYSWLEDFTARGEWLGGKVDAAGSENTGEAGLKAFLVPDFELLESREMPLVIREHRRKYQYIVSQALVWRRRFQ